MSGKDATSSPISRLFGHPFEVQSSLSPGKAKAALRQHKQGWLNPKTGPRGWILGSFLCLQWSALGDRGAPVVLARISDDGFGSRVRRRAGVDLASLGLIGAVAWIVFLSIYVFALRGGDLPSALLFCGVAVIPGAVLWLRLVSSVDAEPLVCFIRRVLEKPTKRLIEVVSSHFDRTPVQSAKLNVNGREVGAPSESEVAQAILAMKPDEFLIIDFGSNNFMQTAFEYDHFVMEKCEGSDDELYRAKGDFERYDVVAVMAAYLRRSQPSKAISWEKVRG